MTMKQWAVDYEARDLVAMNESAQGFCMRSSLSRMARAGLLTLTAGALLSAGCASTDRTLSTAARIEQQPEKSEDLQVVDCLLPAEVRRVSRQRAQLNARQAIKTSASDCETRGGSHQGSSETSSSSD
jgi:hypothetical protein